MGDMYRRYAAEYNRHLRSGELGACGLDLFKMASELREDGLRVDELKVLMLSFHFDLSGVASGPMANRNTARRAAGAYAASGLSWHEMKELYLETIRPDTTPNHTMSPQDSFYVFNISMAGRFDEADEIVARFVKNPRERQNVVKWWRGKQKGMAQTLTLDRKAPHLHNPDF